MYFPNIPLTRNRVNLGADEYLFNYALRSHEFNETGRIRAPLTGRIRERKKIGLAFFRIGFKF